MAPSSAFHQTFPEAPRTRLWMGLAFLFLGIVVFVSVFLYLPRAARESVLTATQDTLDGLRNNIAGLQRELQQPDLIAATRDIQKWARLAIDPIELNPVMTDLGAARDSLTRVVSSFVAYEELLRKADLPKLVHDVLSPSAEPIKQISSFTQERTDRHKDSMQVLGEAIVIAQDALLALAAANLSATGWKDDDDYTLGANDRDLLLAAMEKVGHSDAKMDPGHVLIRTLRGALAASDAWSSNRQIGLDVANGVHYVRDKRDQVVLGIIRHYIAKLNALHAKGGTLDVLDFSTVDSKSQQFVAGIIDIKPRLEQVAAALGSIRASIAELELPSGPPTTTTPDDKKEANPTATVAPTPDKLLPLVRLSDVIARLQKIIGANDQLRTLGGSAEELARVVKRTKEKVDTATAGLQDIVNIPETVRNIAYQVSGPISWLALAFSGLLMATGVASLIRWARLGEEKRINDAWQSKALTAVGLLASQEPKTKASLLGFLAAIDGGKDHGRSVHTPLTLALAELVDSFAQSKKG